MYTIQIKETYTGYVDYVIEAIEERTMVLYKDNLDNGTIDNDENG